MSALHAAGEGLPLAIKIPHVVEQVGSMAGFAAVVGLAILAALYFSQARDLRRLREWAGRAPERAAEAAGRGQPAPAQAPVPGRVVAVPQRQAQAVQPAVPVATAGAAAGAAAAPKQDAPAQDTNGAPPAAEKAADDETEPQEKAATPGGGGAEGTESKNGEPGSEEREGAEAGSEREGAEAGSAGDGGPAKPGMPAPASAAAAGAAAGATAAAGAAGAGTTSPAVPSPAGAAGAGTPSPGGTAGQAPGTPARTGAAPPTRPPGSVLPPRTGAAAPVRRLGAGTAAGNAAISQTGQAPDRKQKRNPVYVALAVIGVLVLGAGAAIGVPKLVNGGTSTTTAKPAKKHHSPAVAPPPTALKDIKVAVLNGTTVPGLAAQIGDQVQNDGFTLGTVSNAPQQQRANSVAMYAPGHARDARVVARKLRIRPVAPVDPNSRSIGGDAMVVVVVGRDQTR